MRTSIIAVFVLLAPFVRAEGECHDEVVQCGKDTVVVFDDTQSPDARYALGWTIRPLAEGAKPVDWANFEKDGSLDGCVFKIEETSDKKATHEIIDGVIDLRNKSFKPIPDADPIGPFHNHRNIAVKWVDDQHALILVDQRWHTEDAFFVRPASNPLEVTSLLPAMNQLVEKLISEKRPLADEMRIYYAFSDSVTTQTPGGTVVDAVPCKIKNGILHTHFGACIPKGSFEDFEGTLLISIENGKPIKAISDTPADKPFVGELGEADKRLNKIYDQLRSSLTGDERKKLIADQREWISTRNEESKQAAPRIQDDTTLGGYRAARNQEALKLTRERTAVLQKQFEATRSK